jgi:hypothetical protein
MFIYNFYIPDKKYDLLFYLGKRYPEDITKFRKLRKTILKAIYLNIRNKENALSTQKATGKKKLSEVSRGV